MSIFDNSIFTEELEMVAKQQGKTRRGCFSKELRSITWKSDLINNVFRYVIPELEKGSTIILDRFTLCNKVYLSLEKSGLGHMDKINGNMILSEGLVLQQKSYWKDFLGKEIVQENNSAELYFEEENIERFIVKLENLYPNIKYVNKLMTHSWGQKVIRFYNLDGNLIEVGTPIR